MHPDSPFFDKSPDFEKLANEYPPLRPYVKGSQINFKDPAALRELTKAILRCEFGIVIDLPEDRLCPPVPNRLNYVLWIQDLLKTTPRQLEFDDDILQQEARGVDIGTGASCIYPLLACTLFPWSMCGTDIDSESLQYARKNVDLNNLASRIQLLETVPEGPLLPSELFANGRLDFCMCNPPFYENADELYRRARQKSLEPLSSCTGSLVEMCSPGGEVGFITRLLEESLQLKEQVRWYSTMLGKLASISTLVQRLKDYQIDNYAVTEFVQGTTKRWGLAWSFLPYRPREDVACSTAFALRNVIPKSPKYVFDAPLSASFTIPLIQRLLNPMRLIGSSWKDNKVIGIAAGNTWSRSARRKMALEVDDGEAALGFRITVVDKNDASQVSIEWRIGHDPILFESFCGKIKSVVQQKYGSPSS